MMKVKKNDIIKILPRKDKKSTWIERINYNKWVEFIETNKDFFLWFEKTEEGMHLSDNIDLIPEWAKEGVLYRLNKTTVYSTNKLVKNSFDLIIRYFRDEGVIKIDIENKLDKNVGRLLLEMAKYVNGKLIINDNIELENIEQLD